MALTGDNVLAATLLFKTILGAAWAGSLVLVERIMRNSPVLERCLAIVVFGWLPLSAAQSLAEGHNDILMAWFAVLWLYLLLRGRWWAPPVALVASFLCKYTSGPLFLLDALYVVRPGSAPAGQTITRYLLRLIFPTILGLAVFLLFYRSFRFFDGVNLIRGWEFLQPSDAVEAVEEFVGLPLLPLSVAVIAFFPAVARCSPAFRICGPGTWSGFWRPRPCYRGGGCRAS
jgi:hypothetical protein